MNVVPFLHEGLGNSSYLVEVAPGEALLIDPDRSFDRYVRAADDRGWQVTTILETHVHADFVTGAVEGIHALDAIVYQPAEAGCAYEHRPLGGGQPLAAGETVIEVIASPGHTPEHMSYLLRQGGGPPALFSGGSIIVGGAARTDLIALDQTEELTRHLFRTLREAFSHLPDETLLYPTHGGGSFCSAGTGSERWSTLGEERGSNPVLRVQDEDAFARWFPQTFPAAPDYFFRMRAFNQAGPRLRAAVPPAPRQSPDDFERMSGEATIIDVRSTQAFSLAHVPGSLSIPFRDAYPIWLGWLVPPETPLLFVLGDVPLERVQEESMLVGYERFAGWLDGDMPGWHAARKREQRQPLVGSAEARRLLRDGGVALDVREPDEVRAGGIGGALLIPLGELRTRTSEVPKDRPVVVYCAHGERASTAISLLERAGVTQLANLEGGYDGWAAAEGG